MRSRSRVPPPRLPQDRAQRASAKPRAGSYYIEGTDHTGEPVKLSLKTSNRDLAKRLFAEHVKATLEARASGPMALMNFADAYELYKEREGENSNTPHLDKMLPLIGTRKLADLTQADLDQLARLRRGCSPATLKRHVYTPFMAAYNACVENEPPLADAPQVEDDRGLSDGPPIRPTMPTSPS